MKFIYYYTTLIFILLFITPTIFTNTITIEFEIHEDETANIKNMYYSIGKQFLDSNIGNYEIVLLNKNNVVFLNRFFVTFQTTTHFENISDIVTQNISLPRIDFDEIILFKMDKKIFKQEINKEMFCNFDGVCNNFENAISCPSDCPMHKPDGICNPIRDGICDPDCPVGIDPDCLEKNDERFIHERKAPIKIIDAKEEEYSNLTPAIFILGFFLVIIFILASFYYIKRRN